MVDAYRDTRAAQIEAAGGWRNETAHEGAIVFGRWLQVYEWPPRSEFEVSTSVDTDIRRAVA